MVFDTADDAYDRFMGRYSVELAPAFADFAGIEPGQRVLDVGAGTGALAVELVHRIGPEAVALAEPSPRFVEALRRRLPDLEVAEAPAEELPWPDEAFDAALAQLVVTFMRDAPAGIAEMRRVVRPGGVVAVCMWDREGMEMLAAIDARAPRSMRPAGDEADPLDARTSSATCSRMPACATSRPVCSTWSASTRATTSSGRR